MYFIPRNNTKLYCLVAGMHPAYRYLLTTMFLGALTYVWLFGVYFRVQHALTHYDQEITQKKQYCSLGAHAQSDGKKLQESLAYFRNELQNYGKNTVDWQQVQLAQLVDAASTAGVVMHNCVVEKEQNNTWYSQMHVAAEFTGSRQSLMKFFERCFSANRLVTCDALRLTKNDSNLYDLACSLSMYAITVA